jgi:hypothetical protein
VSVGPGQDPLSNQQQSALASALGRVGPPNNPKTLAQRTDPQYLWLSKLHSIRKAIDETIQESLDERPPEEQSLITAIRHAIDRLIRGVKGAEASMKLASSVVETLAPQIAQQLEAQLEQMTRAPMVPGAPQPSGMQPGGGMPPPGPQPGPMSAMAGMAAPPPPFGG